MQSSSVSSNADEIRTGVGSSGPVSRLVDWVTAVLLVLGGLAFTTFGSAISAVADRDRIARWVADGRLTSTELSEAELIDTTLALFTWGGIGLIVTGLFLIVGGIGFLIYRRSARERAATEANQPDSVTLAIIGAVVTVVTSFVPLSPILGGIVSGYFRGGDGPAGARVGAYAGLVAAVPFALLALFILGGFAVVATELGLGTVAVFVALTLVFSSLVGLAYLVGLSALGGYIGVSLAARSNKSHTR
jgi:hypothetical protein